MPQKVHIYAWTIIAVGVFIAACAGISWRPDDPAATLVCLVLAMLASTFKIKLPGLTGTISPSFVFVLVAVGQLSFAETVFIGAAAALVQSLWRPKVQPSRLQLGFNCATLAIAGGLAHGVAHGLFSASVVIPNGLPLMVSGLVLLVTNTMLVAIILCLIQKSPLYKAWRSIQLWSVPYYVAGGVLAHVWAQAPLTSSISVAILAVMSTYLLSISYRGFVGMVGAQASA